MKNPHSSASEPVIILNISDESNAWNKQALTLAHENQERATLNNNFSISPPEETEEDEEEMLFGNNIRRAYRVLFREHWISLCNWWRARKQ